MFDPPIPVDDDERVRDLQRLDLMLTEPEAAFDQLIHELARIFDVHGVMMSFVDRDTQYFKSAVGLSPDVAATRTEPRALSVCSYVIGENRMLVVDDLMEDDRFRDSLLVRSSGARFYAGTPLRSEEGRAVGVLCIVDLQPRSMNERERELLAVIAEGVMAQVKLQLASRQLLERTKQIERDLEQAVQMQRFLLPPKRLEGNGWRISHVYRPYKHLAGDFLAVHPGPHGRRMILVADVSGHGTTAALTTAMTKTAFHRVAATADTPRQLLSAINRELVDMIPPGQFMTALAALFEPERRRLTLASAGHPRPLLIRDGRVEIVEHANETLLLVQPDLVYDEQTTIVMSPGERLIVYTDGATDAVDRKGERLGADGLCRLIERVVRENPPELLDGIVGALGRRAAGDFSDDVALLCVECVEPS